MTHPIFKDGDVVKINYAGDHYGKAGVVSRSSARAGRRLIYVTVPDVVRELVFYPGDLELA